MEAQQTEEATLETCDDTENDETECQENKFAHLLNPSEFMFGNLCHCGNTHEEKFFFVLRELHDLKKMLLEAQEMVSNWKKQRKLLYYSEQQLRQVSAKHNAASNSLYSKCNLPKCEYKLSVFREQANDTEEALHRQFTHLRAKLNDIELSLAKRVPDKKTHTEQYRKDEELEKLQIRTKLIVSDRNRLVAQINELQAEREKHAEEMNRIMSKKPQSETIMRDQQTIRMQRKKIAALRGLVQAYEKIAANLTAENEKLVEEEEAVEKLYLEEKQKNSDLMATLNERRVKKDSSLTKSDLTDLPTDPS